MFTKFLFTASAFKLALYSAYAVLVGDFFCALGDLLWAYFDYVHGGHSYLFIIMGMIGASLPFFILGIFIAEFAIRQEEREHEKNK